MIPDGVPELSSLEVFDVNGSGVVVIAGLRGCESGSWGYSFGPETGPSGAGQIVVEGVADWLELACCDGDLTGPGMWSLVLSGRSFMVVIDGPWFDVLGDVERSILDLAECFHVAAGGTWP